MFFAFDFDNELEFENRLFQVMEVNMKPKSLLRFVVLHNVQTPILDEALADDNAHVEGGLNVEDCSQVSLLVLVISEQTATIEPLDGGLCSMKIFGWHVRCSGLPPPEPHILPLQEHAIHYGHLLVSTTLSRHHPLSMCTASQVRAQQRRLQVRREQRYNFVGEAAEA